ncbi:MAG TPA: SLC13 family permease [Firmicutes bacterium]|nr:SLC13 family permease [Bacillota bacterium]
MITEMQLVFLILAGTTICFLIPGFRPDLVAIASLMVLKLTGILTVPETFSGFSNSVVIMIAALFIVGEGVFQTGLAQRAGDALVQWSGKSEFRMTMFMILLVAVLSAFLSNTGTVAILLPVVVILCRSIQLHPGKLLMPMAFASSMGGTLSLIGTAPNLLARQSLLNYGYEGLSFFAFTPIGIIILVAGGAYLWFLGRRWLDKPPENELGSGAFNAADLLEQYQVTSYIHAVQVPARNSFMGKTLKELQWPTSYDVTVLDIIRREKEGLFRFYLNASVRQFTAGPDYALGAGDTLIVYADTESLNRFVAGTGLQRIRSEREPFQPEESSLAELILTPQSRLNNYSLMDINFREKYGLTVLALKPQYQEPKSPAPDERITYGDALLVHGKWKDIDLLTKEKSDLVVIQHAVQPPAPRGRNYLSLIAAVIVLWMLLMMVLEWLPVVVAAVLAALLMLLTGCVRNTDQAYRSVNWQTIILIAAMLPMATALEKTGGVAFMTEGLISSLGMIGPVAVLGGLYLITSAFSQFISNTATAVLLYPVAVLSAQQMGVNPVPMVMAVAFSASMAFATPVATPPNAMVMAAGKYSFFDFMRVGVPLQLFVALITILIIPLFFPF